MSELADETDSKSVTGNRVWVRVPLPALFSPQIIMICDFFISSQSPILFATTTNLFPFNVSQSPILFATTTNLLPSLAPVLSQVERVSSSSPKSAVVAS